MNQTLYLCTKGEHYEKEQTQIYNSNKGKELQLLLSKVFPRVLTFKTKELAISVFGCFMKILKLVLVLIFVPIHVT